MSQDIQNQLAEKAAEITNLKAQVYDLSSALQNSNSNVNSLQEALSSIATKVGITPDEQGQIEISKIVDAVREIDGVEQSKGE
jgi:archaellum component FlaC